MSLLNLSVEQNMDDEMQISDKVKVRAPRADDKPQLYKWAKALATVENKIAKDTIGELVDSTVSVKGIVDRALTSNQLQIIEYGDTDVGYVLLTERSLPVSYELTLMYISPKYRKKGIGLAVIDYVKVLAKGLNYDLITLGVLTDNVPAKALYASSGFKVFEEIMYCKV